MIPAERFLASKHLDENEWLAVRRRGVTATAVANVAGVKDRRAEAIDEWLAGEPVEVNDYMLFGAEAEAALMATAHLEYGILPVDWVIAGEDSRHLATPDGLSLDHSLIAECKTTGDGWPGVEEKLSAIPIRYRRQVQWQLHVTGAERCLFLWQLRVPSGDWFRFGWFEPRRRWIERDEVMIADLIGVAEEMEARRGELQPR